MKKVEVYEYSEQEVLSFLRKQKEEYKDFSDEKILDFATDYDLSPVFREGDEEEYYWSESKLDL